MTHRLENKITLITGGSSGIGRAAALAFAQAGATVVIADIDAAGGQETVTMLQEKGAEALFLQVNVAKAIAVAGMVNHVVERYGRLDVAVNNAGIEGEPRRTADVTEADFDQIMAVNVKGVWLCLKHQLPQMMAQGGGSIINIAAVIGLTRSAAVEYARKGIRVNAVCPSVIQTPMAKRGLADMPHFLEAAVGANPSRRLGQPEEVADAILWLASDASSFTNGATLTVDGGFTAQ